MWELLTPDLNKEEEKQWNQQVVAFLEDLILIRNDNSLAFLGRHNLK
jgi:hypothetical protein